MADRALKASLIIDGTVYFCTVQSEDLKEAVDDLLKDPDEPQRVRVLIYRLPTSIREPDNVRKDRLSPK